MKFSNVCFFVLAACMMAAPIGQANADDAENFRKMVSDREHQRQASMAAMQSDVVVNNPCPSSQYTAVNQFSIFSPLSFDRSGQLLVGAWKQSVAEKGCGHERLLNVFFFQGPDKIIKIMPLVPGTSRADPILQRDAKLYAAAAAQWPEKDCKTAYVEDTEFLRETGEPLEGAKGKPWDELWTLTSCTKKAKVLMHFIPDKTGTTINTKSQETKFVPYTASK